MFVSFNLHEIMGKSKQSDQVQGVTEYYTNLHSSTYFASFRKFNETRNVASSTNFFKLIDCKLYFINRNTFVSELNVN
jgi:hypothetical protein